MERLKRRLGERNVAQGYMLFKIAVLMEDDRYYIRTEAGIYKQVFSVLVIFFQGDGKRRRPLLIQALIHFDDFPVTGPPAVVIIVHNINKQCHTQHYQQHGKGASYTK
ncbi:UNVERIFIED_ORG: hypothetical protein DFS12_10596 [Chitinophaga ginsengisegetis]